MAVLLDVTERPVVLLGWDANRTGEPDGIPSGLTVGTAATVAVVAPDGVGSAATFGTASSVAFISATGIDASGGGVGAPSVVASMHPDGVASTEATGSPQLDAAIDLVGIPTDVQFGVPEAFTSMNPAGIDATGGGAGTPATDAAIAVTGLSSGVQFGDPGILATVFVIPGPVDPSNDFGDTRVIQRRLIFRPPTQTLGWGWYKRFEGISLIKKDGVWSEVPWPTVQDTTEADVYLAGGRDHAVSTSLAAELISEGYSISEEY